MSDKKILLLVMLVVVAAVVGGGIGFQAWRANRLPKAVPATSVTSTRLTITDGQPLRFGNAAPVTVALYEDFHCPHCADFETELGPTLAAAQVRGAVQLEIFPMSFIDVGSGAAANAMACASEAGFGPSYYSGLFANHTLSWSDKQLLDLASKVGATSTPAFDSCVRGRAHQGWVDSINAAADRSGVQGTPTMFLDGAPVTVSGLTPETLDRMIGDAATN